MITLVRDRADARLLRASAIFFGLAVLFHNGDHMRRGGDSVSTEVFWLGSAAMLLEIGVVALVLMRHPAAPAVAAAIGFSLALGYVSVHFTPERGFFSDSFVNGGASALSIVAASLESITAFGLGLAGLAAYRRYGFDGSGEAALSWRDALLHPLVIAMIIGNAIIFAVSIATR